MALNKKMLSDEVLKGNRSIFPLIAAITVLVIAAFYMGSSLVSGYKKSAEIQAQTESMKNSITDFKNQTAFVNNQDFRPVPADKVDAVQADLMMAFKTYQLNLTGYKVAAGSDAQKKGKVVDKKAKDGDKETKNNGGSGTYKAFDITLEGSYENTVKMLMDFKSSDALIKIMELSMKPKAGLIEMRIVYRVYTK